MPCITLRENTERPITIELGTNVLGGTSKDSILKVYRESIEGKSKEYKEYNEWEGERRRGYGKAQNRFGLSCQRLVAFAACFEENLRNRLPDVN